MRFSRNDVVLLPIPFTDLTSRKVRPAIVLGGITATGDLFLVPISSQLANTAFALTDWRSAGLNVACGVKGQLATVEERLAIKRVGRLSSSDSLLLDQHLRAWLGL